MNQTIAIPLPEFGGPILVDTPQESEDVKRLRRVNSLWETHEPLWSFYLSAYQGAEEFANERNMFKHFRENEEDFRDRVSRIHNTNYCEPIVDFFSNFIFAESIERNGGTNAEFYRTFCSDVNLKGDTIDQFMKSVCDDMQIFGMVYTLVDAPNPVETDLVLTKEDEKRLNIRPYWVHIRPDEIVDWVVDEFDEFIYAKRKQVNTRLPVGSHDQQVIEKYTEFYQDRYVISEIDVTNATKPVYLGSQTFINTFGKVPIVVTRFKKSKRYAFMGLSFIRDFAYNNREILNLTSMLQEFLYRQAFNILAREVDSAIPMAEQQDGVIGTANVLDVPKGAKMPEYISPPADPAKFIQSEMTRIKNEMFIRASQDACNELFNGEGASGFSQAQSFFKSVPHISSRADILERTENLLMSLTMQAMGKSWDGKVKYKDRYELTSFTDALTQFQILARDLQIPSETFVKEGLKRLVREYDGKIPPDILAQMEHEIDEMKYDAWVETQKEALVGKAQSPGDQQKPKSTGTLAEVSAEAKVDGPSATNQLKGE